MELNKLTIIEQLYVTTRLFKHALHWTIDFSIVAFAGIVCYIVWVHNRSIGLDVLVLLSWTLISICTVCWLVHCIKQLLKIYSESSKTELTLYQKAVCRERTAIGKLAEQYKKIRTLLNTRN